MDFEIPFKSILIFSLLLDRYLKIIYELLLRSVYSKQIYMGSYFLFLISKVHFQKYVSIFQSCWSEYTIKNKLGQKIVNMFIDRC